MKSLSVLLAVGASALSFATAANAVVLDFLTEGSGWHYGESHSMNSAAMFSYDGSGGQFTLKAVVTGTDELSFVDGYATGDKYTVTVQSLGTVTSNSQFLDASAFDPIVHLNAGPFGSTFGPDWLNAHYGHLQDVLTPGTYLITIKDIKPVGGLPAGWGIRLDDAVPEASTWAMMLVGALGLGAALRNRRRAAIA